MDKITMEDCRAVLKYIEGAETANAQTHMGDMATDLKMDKSKVENIVDLLKGFGEIYWSDTFARYRNVEDMTTEELKAMLRGLTL
jgi:hypothetical protein